MDFHYGMAYIRGRTVAMGLFFDKPCQRRQSDSVLDGRPVLAGHAVETTMLKVAAGRNGFSLDASSPGYCQH